MPTITNAEKIKTLEGNASRGPLDVYKVTLDSGQEAELLRKPASGPPFGEVTVEESQHGLKAKLVQQGGPGSGRKYEADARGLRGKNASMAVAYAKDLVVAGKVDIGQLSLYAEKFYEFIESKAKVDG